MNEWVFVAGCYRSASTTQYQIVRDIVEITDSGIGVGYHTESKLAKFDKRDHGIVVCKVFEPLWLGFRGKSSYAKKFFDEQRVKAIVTMRDPRDIIVSMMKRSEGLTKNGKKSEWNFEETATINFPIWLSNLEKWIDLGDITLVTKYAEMTNGLSGLITETKRIAQHLIVELSDKQIRTIASCYTIEAMNKRKTKLRQTKEKADPWIPAIPGIVFGTSNIHKTWLSGPKRRMVEQANQHFMERFGYL